MVVFLCLTECNFALLDEEVQQNAGCQNEKKKINFQPTYLRVGVRAAEVNHTNIYYDNLIQPFKTGEYYSFDVMGVLPKSHASTIISIFLGSKMVKRRLTKRFVYEYLCALSNMRAKINRVMN